MNGEAYVEVERDANLWRDRIRAYRVFIDGTEAGRSGHGSTCKLVIPPGSHRIWMSIGWCRSPQVDFAVRPGETARFRCGPSGGSWRIFYDMTIGWGRYISLRRR